MEMKYALGGLFTGSAIMLWVFSFNELNIPTLIQTACIGFIWLVTTISGE